MSMCVRRMRPPEKWMSIHLPLASTFSMVRPVTGVSISTRSSLGRTDSKAGTVWLAGARGGVGAAGGRWSVRAARKIVSPSGMGRKLTVDSRKLKGGKKKKEKDNAETRRAQRFAERFISDVHADSERASSAAALSAALSAADSSGPDSSCDGSMAVMRRIW